jgi:hypothetical protein
MADDPKDDTTPDLNRPKRPAPTIELTATDVTPEVAAAETPDIAAAAPEMTETPEATIEPAPPLAPKQPSRALPVLLGAVSGASAAALVLVAAWLAGWPGSPEPAPANTTALDDLTARVARIESRPASVSAAGTTTPDATLAPRLDALEKSLTALRGDLAAARSDITTTRGQSDKVASALDELKATPRDAVAAPPDLSPLNGRIAQIETAVRAQGAAVAQQNAKPADDIALRRVVAATLLDTSVRQSEPYASALAAAKPLASDANALKPLEAFAASGIPTAASLNQQLGKLAAASAPARAPATTTGANFIDRLQAGAARLVRVDRTDNIVGDDRGAVVARASAAAQRGDIAGAKRELAALTPADRAAFQPWIDQADARDAALAASRQFAADAMAAFSKSAR